MSGKALIRKYEADLLRRAAASEESSVAIQPQRVVIPMYFKLGTCGTLFISFSLDGRSMGLPGNVTEPWNPDGDFTKLRNNCFSIARGESAPAGAAEQAAPWGAIMEVGYPDTALTIASFSDGKTCVLRSAGTHFVGGEIAPPIRHAGQRFLKQAAQAQTSMHLTTTFPLPDLGQVRFYLRTDYGVYTAEVMQQELNARRHELTTLFYGGLCILHEYLLVHGNPAEQ